LEEKRAMCCDERGREKKASKGVSIQGVQVEVGWEVGRGREPERSAWTAFEQFRKSKQPNMCGLIWHFFWMGMIEFVHRNARSDKYKRWKRLKVHVHFTTELCFDRSESKAKQEIGPISA
jgi:hypothetical protein